MYALIQAAAQGGHLTFMGVLRGIPHDLTAMFVYAISAAAVGWVVIAGRRTENREADGE